VRVDVKLDAKSSLEFIFFAVDKLSPKAIYFFTLSKKFILVIKGKLVRQCLSLETMKNDNYIFLTHVTMFE
jgi:hypothetical protein